MNFSIREKLFQIWYWYVSKIDKNADVILMNYGYHKEDLILSLDKADEPNRYSIQLYYHLTLNTQITGKDIIEIGSGRGGGLAFLTKKFAPASAIGVELNDRAVHFCTSYYKLPHLSFMQGDAQKLSLGDNCCDIVFNVESSHRYPDFRSFINEVYRVLRPGGKFLFTDFRYKNEMGDLKKTIETSNFTISNYQKINKQVVDSLDLDTPRRQNLVKKLAPKFLHSIALNFAGTKETETYNSIVNDGYIYFSYELTKP